MAPTSTKKIASGDDDDKKRTQRIQKKRLFDFSDSFWAHPEFSQGQDVSADPGEKGKKEANSEELAAAATTQILDLTNVSVSNHYYCNTSNMQFDTVEELREHYKSDLHRLNLKLKLKGKPPIDAETFERDFENLSDASLSGSEDEESDDEVEETQTKKKSNRNASVKLQFKDPTVEEGFIIAYKVALPDEASLHSLEKRGAWAVIMSGGGHFSAAIWNAAGEVLRHKSFHRYTTRRKQGGAQSAADAGGSRIKSAGSTLRRYGEQALQQEVQQLLRSWADDLSTVQSVFLRVSKRDKKDLLFSWDDSPLLYHKENGMCRTIPFPTRRATYSEVTRVYEQLSTIILSPISLIAPVEEPEPAPKPKPKAPSKSSKPKVPAEKGTSHLKKREPKPGEREVEEVKVELDTKFVQLLQDIADEKSDAIEACLTMEPALKALEFEVAYFESHEKLKNLSKGCGLVGVAAALGSLKVLEWMLLNDVPLLIGTSPYLVTKAKSVRTFLRRFWANHPDLHDYKEAEIPSPLSEADVAAAAQKEREKRKREKEKKKEKALLTAEAAKPPEVRARELRAKAAEARMNRAAKNP